MKSKCLYGRSQPFLPEVKKIEFLLVLEVPVFSAEFICHITLLTNG